MTTVEKIYTKHRLLVQSLAAMASAELNDGRQMCPVIVQDLANELEILGDEIAKLEKPALLAEA
jgi:hypothetical protein